MTHLPGTLFMCRSITSLYETTGLYRTASVYTYGERLETQPDPQTVYVVCKDGSVQAVSDPEKPIGWEVGDGWYRLTQTGFEPTYCDIKIIGRADSIPDGRGSIGSHVHIMRPSYSREVAFDTESQNAQITHEDDEDDDEVTSSISFSVI
jgi:hypothetical protein